MKRKSGESGSYHHGDLRRVLLVTARDMLEHEGVDALSLREVARRAGVSHNAPYRHFTDRDSLLAALACDGYVAFGETMQQAMNGVRSDGKLLAMGRAYVGFALEHPQLFRLMFADSMDMTCHQELREAAMGTFRLLADTVREEIGQHDARIATVAAWSLVHGLAHLLLDHQLKEQLCGGLAESTVIRRVTALFAESITGK
jgi:AcrR family transcriptional regulator